MSKVTIATVDVLNRGLSILRAKVAELNKRAARIKVEPITLTVIRALPMVRVVGKGFGGSDTIHTVEINGIEPVIDGFRMIAKIEFAEEVGTIVKTMPGVESVDLRYRTCGPICEHCNTLRKRNDVFVLANSDGVEKVIGRNCLADYLRCGDANSLATFADFIDAVRDLDCSEDSDSDGYGGGHYSDVSAVPVVEYLAMVSIVMRKWGWVPRSACNEFTLATSDRANYAFNGKLKDRTEYIEKNELYPSAEDYRRAESALEWAKSKLGDRSDYLNTLGQLASNSAFINFKYAGYYASILSAHAKANSEAIEYAKRKAERVFIGKVGERLRNLVVTVIRKRFVENAYGVKTIITFESPVGDKRAVLTWFASGDRDNDFIDGETYTVDATVKEHEAHDRYGDSTVVSRVNIK